MTRSMSRVVDSPADGEAPDGVMPTADGAWPRGGEIPRAIAKRIRLVVFDVDGVLTDASVYVGRGPDGKEIELKRFDIQDGLALKLLKSAGIEVALVSGRVSEATTLRAEELGIECHQDAGAKKLPVVRGLIERLGIEWNEVAMVGDDLPDLPVLTRVGFPIAVANAVPEVLREADWCTRREGGRGAVREFIRAFLLARGEWDRVVSDYCAARTDE